MTDDVIGRGKVKTDGVISRGKVKHICLIVILDILSVSSFFYKFLFLNNVIRKTNTTCNVIMLLINLNFL